MRKSTKLIEAAMFGGILKIKLISRYDSDQNHSAMSWSMNSRTTLQFWNTSLMATSSMPMIETTLLINMDRTLAPTRVEYKSECREKSERYVLTSKHSHIIIMLILWR